jgi:glycosyltransferase involved in cell wall biosynthesis
VNRVLHIVPLVSDGAAGGGPVRGTLRQSAATRSGGWDPAILSLWQGRPEAAPRLLDGVPLVLFKFRRLPGHQFAGAYSFRALWWLIRRRRDYDVFHVHSGRDLWIVLAMIMLRCMRCNFVLQTHGMLVPRKSPITRLYDVLLTRAAVGGARWVLYLTSHERKDLETWIAPSRLVEVINGVDAPNESPVLVTDTPRAVFVSRIHPRKRLIDLVNAVGALRRDAIPLPLDIFGPDDGDLDRCMDEVARLGLGDLVTYRGTLPYLDVRERLKTYEIFVLPSIHEPFPNAVLEAMATGMACLITSSCGLAPILRELKAGLVVEPGADAISDGLRDLLANSEARETLGMNALAAARDYFSMDSVGQRLAEVYVGAAKK